MGIGEAVLITVFPGTEWDVRRVMKGAIRVFKDCRTFDSDLISQRLVVRGVGLHIETSKGIHDFSFVRLRANGTWFIYPA